MEKFKKNLRKIGKAKDLPLGKGSWETTMIKDGIEYKIVLKSYEILEKQGSDNQVVKRRTLEFAQICDKFGDSDDIV